jgi:hypothetical protein
VIVAWLEAKQGAQSAWRVRHVAADGTLGAPIELAQVAAARRSGRLYLAPLGDDSVLATWTSDGQPPQVTAARIRLAD